VYEKESKSKIIDSPYGLSMSRLYLGDLTILSITIEKCATSNRGRPNAIVKKYMLMPRHENSRKNINVMYMRLIIYTGFGMEIGFMNHFNTRPVNTLNYSAIADFHTLQITNAHTKSFSLLCVDQSFPGNVF
jgi:hypothetical protein